MHAIVIPLSTLMRHKGVIANTLKIVSVQVLAFYM